MSRLAIALVGIAWSVAMGQPSRPCAGSSVPLPTAGQIQRDLDEIFGHISGLSGTSSVAARELSSEEDFLIVPGSRVGPFEIDSTLPAIRIRSALGKAQKHDDPRYEQILPTGYIPSRTFYEGAGGRITFAMSDPGARLSEVFVRDPGYVTENGIRVGSSETRLQAMKEFTRRPLARRRGRCYVGDGISFLVEGSKVYEVVIFRRRPAP